MKKLITLLVTLILAFALVVPASAVTFYGDESWNVAFTQENEMVSSFKTSQLDDLIRGMQPGDNAIIKLALKNQNSVTTRWYMTNEVIDSLEDDSLTASGGAYTYRLVYTDPAGNENVLFDSDTVGGDTISNAGEGLNEATSALEDFFYLDSLDYNQSGFITLEVALEGETQGNDYQDTLANLQMNFAVELEEPTRRQTTIVKTGDETDMMPYIIAALVSGLLLLVFAIFSVKHRKSDTAKKGVRVK